MPPTERNGRVHTSTITVAVMPEPRAVDLVLAERDLEWSTCRGSGAGGQARNKTENAVILVHTPTGTRVRAESERSQLQNKATALSVLRARLLAAKEGSVAAGLASDRRRQVGSGMRGDKSRTIQEQNGMVVDHRTGRRMQLREYLRGDLRALYSG